MDHADSSPPAPKWRPLERLERRVAGVLAEKAKTTPDAYPLTLNSIVTGSNQKSNRYPLMQLDDSQASEALDSLRAAGAVTLVQGDSRVERYRHMLYDWLGVDKAELAVMTELLLRGAQTLGELRGRAARMEPFPDLGRLLPVVDSLIQKRLVIYLTPPGRGAVVTHNLYQPQELAKVKAEVGSIAVESHESHSSSGPVSTSSVTATAPLRETSASRLTAPAESTLRDELASLKREVADLREHADAAIEDLRREVSDLKSQLGA